MLARSIYISQFNDDYIIDDNIDLFFTSFHIAEEFDDHYKEKAIKLLKILKQNNKKIIVDISPRGLSFLGYDNLISFINEYQIDYLRFDYDFEINDIIDASNHCMVALNASTLNTETIRQFNNNVIAIHNFYPRPETGLDIDYFIEMNDHFRQNNIKVGAFISGDENLRGPLFKGLVTLEENRFQKPYLQFLQMRELVDIVIVADMGLSLSQQKLINETIKDDIIRIPVKLSDQYHDLYNKVFTNREDSPKDIIRIKESREYASFGRTIKPDNCIDRQLGSITIDNEFYLRYSGEMQIMKKDYASDNKVNVIGKIDDQYLDILKYIERKVRFMFVE